MGITTGISLRNLKRQPSEQEEEAIPLKHYCRVFKLDHPEEVELYTYILDESIRSKTANGHMRIVDKKQNFNRDGEFQSFVLWVDRADRDQEYKRMFIEASERSMARLDEEGEGGPTPWS